MKAEGGGRRAEGGKQSIRFRFCNLHFSLFNSHFASSLCVFGVLGGSVSDSAWAVAGGVSISAY